jgi:aspartate-semialdehyde dehydrogenase
MSSEGYRVAVVGATGQVGTLMLELLRERRFPAREVVGFASERSVGRELEGGIVVQGLDDESIRGFDLALFSAGGSTSGEWAPRFVAAGATVIDNSSRWRMQDDVPLVVAEVNPEALEGHRGIIANPNCSTIQLVVALKPIYDAVGIERISVATYQAVSGAGREAIEELAEQSLALMSGRAPPPARVVPKRIAFNCVPQIDRFEDNGYTREEMKIVWETRKILEDPRIRVSATAVRVPVFYGHSEAVSIETATKITVAEVRALLKRAPGVEVLDERRSGGYPTAATEAANRDTVYVGRIREDSSAERGLNLWVVADNVRKGAATNSVQIAEALAARAN